MRKVCLFYSQNNEIVLSNVADIFLGGIHEVRKGLWAFLLDCAFRMLIGSTDKLRSRGEDEFRSVETSVTNNSLSEDYSHLDDHTRQTTNTPRSIGFKPFSKN